MIENLRGEITIKTESIFSIQSSNLVDAIQKLMKKNNPKDIPLNVTGSSIFIIS